MEIDKYGQIIDDALGTAEFDGSTGNADNILQNFFFPGETQRREFGQQVALTKMQQDWAVKGKMAAAKEVGINPHTMAEGIAGAGASSAGAPNSAVGQGAAGIASAAQAAGAVSGAVDSAVNAYEKLALTGENRKNTIADTFLKYKQAGYEDQAAMGLAIANQYLPAEKMLGIIRLSQDIKNLQGEYKVMMQSIEESKSKVKNLDEQIKLYQAEGRKADALAFEAERNAELLFQQTEEAKWLNEKRKDYNIDPRSPVENNIFMLGIQDDPKYQKSLDIVYDSEYNQRKGFNKADIEDNWDKTMAEIKAQKDMDILYGPYLAMIEANKQSIIEFIKMITDNPDDLQGIIGKLANLMSNIGLSTQLENGPVNKARKPQSGNPFRSN